MTRGEGKRRGDLTPDRFYEYGRALTGLERHEGWVRRVAELLPVNPATARRWASGNRPIPGWVEPRLKELCAVRREEIERALEVK